MINDVVVLGAGLGGLATALGLARAGLRVTVLDRDPPPTTDDPEAAFTSWARTSVPQARQPHAFWARSRNLLLARAPDVIDRLREWGIGEWSFIDLAPPELRVPEDDQFASLNVRRLPFELILRRTVLAEPRVEVRQRTVVADLEFDPANGSLPSVRGVRLRDGSTLRADLVIDALGRRTPVPRFLAEVGVEMPTEVEECKMIYYGRYYLQHEGSTLDAAPLSRGGIGLDYLAVAPFRADHRTMGAFICPPSWDKSFRALRHNGVWEAVARTIEVLSPWMDREHTVPITDVQSMAGHQNVLRRPVVHGRPRVRGILPVGDSLCTTNPMNGWGASLALTFAFAAVDAVAEHRRSTDEIALAYADAVMDDAEIYFRTSATQDRLRTYRWRGQGVPSEDRLEAEREDLLNNGLRPAMRRDMYVLRAMLRRLMLIDRPDAIWSDEHAIKIGREVAAWRAVNRPSSSNGPTREEILEVMAEAQKQPS